MKTTYPIEKTKILFSFDFASDYSEEDANNLLLMAQDLISMHGDEEVFKQWASYLKTDILDIKNGINFMNAFFFYGGHELKVKNPYHFLGLLFNKIGLSLDKEPNSEDEHQIFDTFDSIYVSLLDNAHIVNQEDFFYINIYNDNKLKEAIKLSNN